MRVVDRLVITGNSDRGHINLVPMAEPSGANSGGVYMGTDGVLRVHTGEAWEQLASPTSLATAGSDVRAAVKQAANHIPRGNRAVFFGDSITKNDDGEYTITNNQGGGRSYHTYLTMYTGGGVIPVSPNASNQPQHNQGASGETTTQMLARVDTVIGLAPDYVFILGGTNDAGNGVALSTFASNIDSMVDDFLNAGIIPILITPPPSSTAATALRVTQYNAWLHGYCGANNLRLADVWPTTADPATGNWLTDYDADGVHPDFLGAQAMGRAVADAVSDLFPVGPYLTAAKSDSGNLLANGVFVGDANADGTADSWSFAGTGTDSLVAATVGNAQTVANTSGASFNQVVSTGFSAGDLIAVSGIVTTSGMPASPTQGASVRVWFRDSGGAVLGKMDPVWNLGVNIEDAVFYREGVVPAGTANIRIFIGFAQNDAATAAYERVTMRNLTTLGLD